MPTAVGIVGGSLLAGYMGGRASDRASRRARDAQVSAAQTAATTELDMFERTRGDLAPFVQAGREQAGRLGQSVEGGTFDYGGADLNRLRDFKVDENDPIFQFKQRKQEEAINRALSARGLSSSRAGINALSDANMNLLAQETDKQFGRQRDIFGMQNLLGTQEFGREQTEFGRGLSIAELGANAAARTGQLGAGAAQGAAGAQLASGQAQAQNYLSQGNTQAQIWGALGAAPANIASTNFLLNQIGSGKPVTQVPSGSIAV